MEIFFIIGFLSFLFGLLNGSYFSNAALNDNKILRHPVFKSFLGMGFGLSLMTLVVYFIDQVLGVASSLFLFHVACLSVAYLIYSGSYFLGHSFSFAGNTKS